jgi:hypothetical protein
MPPLPLPIKVASYMPDLPDFQNPGSPNARNVLPRTRQSFGPVGAPMVYSSSALSKTCQGAASYLDPSGNAYQFAGDANDLYEFSSLAWTKVSKTLGIYSVPSTGQWRFEYFNGILLATDYNDQIQKFALGTDTAFADLAGTPPKARYMAVVRGFLMLAGTNDGTFGQQPQRAWWSGIGNPTNWPTPGTLSAAQAMSSYNDLTGSGGWNQGIVGNLGNADGAIFQEHAVFRVMFAGPPNVFDFLPAEGVKGCPAPGSIIQVGALVYYLGEDGFYAFDGATSTPIGVDQVDKAFFADLDQNNIARITAAVDPINKIVFWCYPGQGNSGGNPNHILAYRWDLQRWSILDLTAEFMVRLLSIGYTLDQLFTVLGYSIDGLPAPLDSRIWTGGKILLGLFDTSHRLNYLTGSNMAATVDSGEQQLFAGKRALISAARPWVDGGTPSVAVGKRDRMSDAVAYTPASKMNAFGTCPLRTTGRYVRTRLTMPAGATWTNLVGLELDAEPRGER